MFCHKCGKEVKKDANHCPYCGAKLEYAEEHADRQKASGQRKFILPIAAAAVIILLVLAVRMLFMGGYTLNPTDYIRLETKGLNTEGKALLSFDTDRLLEDIGEKKTLTERQKEDIEELLSDAVKDFSMTKSSQLSNGDEITIESNMDKKLLKEYGATLKNGSVKVTVENLTDIQEISLNDYVTAKFSGFEGSGYSYTNVDWEGLLTDVSEKIRAVDSSQTAETFINESLGAYVYSIDTKISPSEGLGTGDEVKVTISMDDTEISGYGIRFVWEDFSEAAEGLAPTEKVSLADYLMFSFSGYEGKGTVSISLDEEKLSEDLQTVFREDGRGAYGILTEESDLESEVSSAVRAVRDAWRSSFTTEADQKENLSEGDTLSVTCRSDDQSESGAEHASYTELSLGLYLEGGQTEVVVEGLIPTRTITLTDYLNCSFAGYDGAGKAEVSFDEEKLQADLETFFEENGRGAYGWLQEDEDVAQEAAYAAEDVLYGWKYNFITELDKAEELSNTDTVTMDCSAEEESIYFSDMGLYLEGGQMEIDVQGLMEPQEVDLSDALTVTFSGIYPKVYAEVQVDYEQPYVYETSLTDMYSETILAQNGDTYSGTITYDEKALLKQGYRVINDQYSYTVSGLNTYALSVDSAADELLLPLCGEMEAFIRTQTAKDSQDIFADLGRESGWIIWSGSTSALETVQLAYDEENARNRLYLVYHVVLPVKELDRSVSDEEVFYTICCYDVEETPAGALQYEKWDCSRLLSASDAAEYMASGVGQMGENTKVSVWTNEKAAELPEASAAGDDEITGQEIPEVPQAGEFDSAAKQQAAAEIICEGHTYARYDIPLTWDLAAAYCEKAGGHLATVTSAREKAIINKLLQDASLGVYWLGASDEEWEGGWQWITGEAFEWTDWYSGNPDNYANNSEGAENYLQVGSNFGYSWNDCSSETDEPTGFILEIEPAEADSSGMENAVYLTDLTAASSYQCGLEEYVQDPYGDDHFYSLYLNASERGMVTYDLNGRWTQLSGTISTWSEAESEAVFEIAVWGDGCLLFSKYDYQKGDAAVPFCIDVAGVKTLSVQTRNRGSQNNGYLFINEAKLTADALEEKAVEKQSGLSELPVIDSSGYEDYTGYGLVTDTYGSIHRDGSRFTASEEGYAIWNLNGEYASLEGLVYTDQASCSEETSVTIEILADGESVFKAENFDVYQGCLPVLADLTGKMTLEIRTGTQAESGSLNVYLADTVLTMAGAEEETSSEADAEANAKEPGASAESGFPEIAEIIEQKASFVLTYGSHRYYLFEEELTWQQAGAFCSAAGASLACPTDEDENMALQALIANGRQDAYWIGGSLLGSQWSWSSGGGLWRLSELGRW